MPFSHSWDRVAHGVHIISVVTGKYFNKNIYNTSLNGRIYPSYDRKTQKP